MFRNRLPLPVQQIFVATGGASLVILLAGLLASCGAQSQKPAATISWAAPGAISHGTPLSAKQLNASASVAGTFAYAPPAGTVPAAGTNTLYVIFSPTDTADYGTMMTKGVALTVTPGAAVVSWPTPSAIHSGTALSAAQLDATASVPGTFAYTPAGGTVPAAGTDTLSVTFIPTNTTEYAVVTKTVSLAVTPAANSGTVVSWTAPAAITYGTALSAAQLDATASVPGTFTYTPRVGTILKAGNSTLSVTFTPSNAADFSTVTKTVSLSVTQTAPTITWNTPAPIAAGTALSAAQLDATASVPGTFTYVPGAQAVLSAGTSPLYVLFTPTDSTDYASVVKTVNLTVDSSAAVVTWATPATISFGTALSATQLDATASLPGTFAYTPALGTTPAVGTDTLSVTFTPTATPSATVTKTVSLTVTKATPTVTWATPAAITAGTALTAAQLNATASVPGTLLYTPAAGAVPAAGTDTLSVTFTPTNTTGYTTVTKTVSLTVNSTSGSTSASTTNIAISSTVLQTGVTHLGMNIDKEDYYDSGQMLRNLTVRNPGFEGELRQTILNCAAVTATSCTDTNQYSTWPANFVQGAQFNFIYGAAAGQTGTVTSSTVAVQSASQGITINFPALAKPPAVGDYVIVKLTIPGNGSQGWWTTTSGGATITSESTDLSPDTPGKQALQITAAGSGQSANVTAYFDSTPGHSFVQLKGTYQITFRAKGTGGSNQLIVSMLRQGGATFFNQTVSLTSAWQNYTYSFTANETGSSIGTAGLGFQINGADVLLDDVSVAPATATAANPTPFRDEVVSTLTALHPGVLRYMDSTTYGSTIANLLAVPFARQLSSWATGSAVPEDMALGLHEFLQLCQTVGAVPYYNMPAGITPTEVQNLMEYLGGPSTSTYGAIRAARGQAAPWTTVFPIIHLELGNELWNNGTFAGAAIPGYAASSNEVTTIFGAAKSSPYYSSSNFDFVMGSWFSVPWWTQQEVALASNYDSVSVSPYLYGSLNDTSSNEAIFGPMFAEPESLDSVSTGLMVQQVEAVSAVGKKTVVYEVNMGTESGSATQAQVNSVVPSVSAGITLAEHLLLMIRDLGITTMNVWALPEYENAFINSANGSETTPLFGTVVDMGGSTNLRRPTFIGQQLANSAILPTVVQTTISGANPTWTQPLSTNGNIQLNNAHEIQSIAFSDGASSRSVVVFNLSRTQALPVTFSGPNAPTGTVTLSQLTSANLTDTNETADVVNTTSSTLSNFQPATSYSLPPFSMTVFSWQVGQ